MNGADEPQAGNARASEQGVDQRSEEELRAAYEEELNRITSAELMLQAAVSLLNIAGRRLGAAPAGPGGEPSPAAGPRDLEQVREAIDGVRALFGVLERRFGHEIAPLRNALSQLQLAYAREAQAAEAAPRAETAPQESPASQASAPRDGPKGEQDSDAREPGPAEASGRLWVPGR